MSYIPSETMCLCTVGMLARSRSADGKTEFIRIQTPLHLRHPPPQAAPVPAYLRQHAGETYHPPQSSRLRRCPPRPSRTWSLTQSVLWRHSGTSVGNTYSTTKSWRQAPGRPALSVPSSVPLPSLTSLPHCPLSLLVSSLPSFKPMYLIAMNISQGLGSRTLCCHRNQCSTSIFKSLVVSTFVPSLQCHTQCAMCVEG